MSKSCLLLALVGKWIAPWFIVIVNLHHSDDAHSYTFVEWLTGCSDMGAAMRIVLYCHFTQYSDCLLSSSLHGTVKWVSAFGPSNNNKWQWWMWMVAAIYRRTHSPSRLAWSEGWRPPGAQSAFIKWTGWTPAVTMVMRTAPQTLSLIIIIIIVQVQFCCAVQVSNR